jgi:putative flippase GtrA
MELSRSVNRKSLRSDRLRRNLPPHRKVSIVGGLGTVTNLALFYALVDVGGMAALLGAVACFAVAVSQNYVLHEWWTFATLSGEAKLSLGRYGKFVVASLVGLAVNAAVLAALIAFYEFPLLVIPQAIGIAAGMAVNFVASRQIVFQRS